MASDRDLPRRRVLALCVGAVAGLAGCPGDGGSDRSMPRETDRTTTTEPQLSTGTETAAAIETGSPASFADDFADEGLANYRAVIGSLGPWSVTSGIDDSRALVDTTGDGSESLIAPAAEALSWPGTGSVGVDVQFGTDPGFHNCKLAVGDLPAGPSTYVQVAPEQVLVSAPSGDVSQQFPPIGPEGVHRVVVTLRDGSIGVTVDDEHTVQTGAGQSLPAGTVAFGIEASRAADGGRTWFDNLDVVPET